MPGAELSITRRMRSLLGPGAQVDTDARGVPRVAPAGAEACALVLETAAQNRWRVQVEGGGHWAAHDAPADMILSTARINAVRAVSAPDLVATVDGGISWPELRRALADQGAWLAADPPGEGRTLGSVVASGTSGPLRAGFGAIRDHILGITLVTGDGRVVRPGGRVVKNVAGFDLTRLVAGSFGAFGVVTSVHLRLRAVPRADLTLIRPGDRDDLVQLGLAIRDAGDMPAALELASPGACGRDRWTLAVRLVGSEMAVEEARRVVLSVSGSTVAELDPPAAAAFWQALAGTVTAHPVTLRLGTLADGLEDALDLLTHHLDDGWLTAGIGTGSLRWSGTAPVDRLRLLRATAAQREIPVTIERAPWPVLSTLGHFGAYREGVGRLVGSLRRVFDPGNVLLVPLGEG